MADKQVELWGIWLPDVELWLETDDGLIRYGYNQPVAMAKAYNLSKTEGIEAVARRIDLWAQEQG